MTSPQQQLAVNRWLPIGWKVMAGWGIFNLVFAVIVPLTSLLITPTIFTFGIEDEKFVGMSWKEIASTTPDMGLWMVLMMVSMCAMHLAYSILNIWVAWAPYRRGERWAWQALVLSSLGSFFYNLLITGFYVSRGLYGMFTSSGIFPSGISLGVPFAVIWIAVLVIGLWLPRQELAVA